MGYLWCGDFLYPPRNKSKSDNINFKYYSWTKSNYYD